MADAHPAYCVACDVQIMPHRRIVPVDVIPAALASPDARRKTIPRNRNGLVNGTGRVRPNGTIKAAPQCRQRDLEFSSGYPASSSGSSDDSDELVMLPKPVIGRSTPNTRSLEILQKSCGIQPLPKATPLTHDENKRPVASVERKPLPYTSGVMMANRRLESVLPKPRKAGEPAAPVAPVPGWTDGSSAWRASTYSCAPPPQTRSEEIGSNRAYIASPHRSAAGVVAESPESYSTTASSYTSSSSVSSDMLSSFEDSFARRSSSRVSLSTSPSTSSLSSSPRKLSGASMLCVPDFLLRPRSGSSPSSDSVNTLPLHERTARRHSSGALPAQSHGFQRMRSPLSVGSPSDESVSDIFEEARQPRLRLAPEQRPSLGYETRSWSYDNVRTYPMMSLPPVKEIRVVDGVETVVEVQPNRQRLFLFADTPVLKAGSA
ncbi:hypothetical protein MKEN_00908200 [Mycena kentingensis (nom. inval.)]|nr:hypothetical protein MKEN_00908200 [Mycena kentingensis (nom. inval.)]